MDTYPEREPLTAGVVRDWCRGVEHAIREVVGTDNAPYKNMTKLSSRMMFGDDFGVDRRPAAELLRQLRSTADIALHTAAVLEDGNRTHLRVVDLHPWIAEPAGPLFEGGHYREAVLAAARNLEVQWKALLGTESHSLSTLADESFSSSAPKPNHPRLRYPTAGTDTNSQAWRNAHVGAMEYAKGCAKRIRNLNLHHPEDTEPGPGETVETLSALSVLARWVTDAEVETDQSGVTGTRRGRSARRRDS